jgi:hypothetical protein
LKDRLLVVIPESADEAVAVDNWLSTHADHVFAVRTASSSLELHGLGMRAEACRVPINICAYTL